MSKAQGNLKGLKPSQIKALDLLLQRKVPTEQVVSPELARRLTELSLELNRQIGVLIERSGKIRDLFVGDAKGLEISDFGRFRGGDTRFRGLRYVHTHLKGEPISNDDLTDLALLRFDLMAVLEVRPNGLPGTIQVAHLQPMVDAPEPWTVEQPVPFHKFERDFMDFIRALESEYQASLRQSRGRKVKKGQRRALLIGVTTERMEELRASMAELEELAESAGVVVVDRILQRRPKLDARYVVGSGKMKELYILCMQKGIDLMIFDGELSGSQVRAISDFGELEVWDRTQLILGLFAERARSRGGKLQVELAMLKYTLPRLVMKDDFLSRLAGGIGAKGPGETKMEVLKRMLRDRITRLEHELEGLSRQRRVTREARQRSGLPTISLVGYTNAGKSTLLNALTGSDILAEDRLFATLDPTSRRLYLGPDRHAILTDTVGFIRELPEDLAKAFKATLEELGEADLLLHVVDASNPDFPDQIMSVNEILDDLALDNIPIITVLNKADRLSEEVREGIAESYPYRFISALDTDSVNELRQFLAEALDRRAELLPSVEGSDSPTFEDNVE
jgi:GTP-binding protein HflX